MSGTAFSFEAIGTHWKIELAEELPLPASVRLEADIMARIDRYDKDYSRFRDDSLVAEMATKAGKYELPSDGPALLLLYERAYRATNGKVTPLIGSVMEEAGYGKGYTLAPSELHRPPSWEDTLLFDGTNLVLRRPALLDVGAAGKGHLIDIIGRLIEDEGYASYLIDAGGDIIHRGGGRKIRIGLEHPKDFSKVIGTVTLADGSICGSSGSRRTWDRFTHIIDPETLASPTEVIATWAVAETTILADMMATCLFFARPERLRADFDFQYVVLHSDMRVERSEGFELELYAK